MDADQRIRFVAELFERDVLGFGDFTLKSGRKSPYFFNMGQVNDGAGIAALGDAYADVVAAMSPQPDVLFGPAYKGIPLAVATAVALQHRGVNLPWVFNRKEAKDHGEGGLFVGAPVAGRVLIIDDILTAGTAAREVVALVRSQGAEVCGVLTALDRRERADDGRTTSEVLADEVGVPVQSVVSIADVIGYLDLVSRSDKDRAADLARVKAYQQAYCA